MTLASCLTRVLGVKWGPAWSPLSALVSPLGRANGQGALGKRGGYAFPWLVVGSVQHDVKRGGMSCSLLFCLQKHCLEGSLAQKASTGDAPRAVGQVS